MQAHRSKADDVPSSAARAPGPPFQKRFSQLPSFFSQIEFYDDLELEKRMGDESRRMDSSSEGIYIRRLTGPVSEGESETCD